MKFGTAEFDEELSSHLSFLLFQTILAIALLVQMFAFLCACDFDVAHAQKVDTTFPRMRTFHKP
jgi:hypothetical protein